jgi:hypothetical protein
MPKRIHKFKAFVKSPLAAKIGVDKPDVLSLSSISVTGRTEADRSADKRGS